MWNRLCIVYYGVAIFCIAVFHPKCVDVWLQKWNRTCPLCKSTIKRRGKPLFNNDLESSHLLTDSGAPSAHQTEGEDERDGPTNQAGASGYGALEQTSPLRVVAASHRRSTSSTSSSSHRSNRLSRSGSKREPTVTTIELNVTSSGETSRSVSHSPSPTTSPLQFHTPRQSEDDDDDETTPSFRTANEENSGNVSVSSSVRV